MFKQEDILHMPIKRRYCHQNEKNIGVKFLIREEELTTLFGRYSFIWLQTFNISTLYLYGVISWWWLWNWRKKDSVDPDPDWGQKHGQMVISENRTKFYENKKVTRSVTSYHSLLYTLGHLDMHTAKRVFMKWPLLLQESLQHVCIHRVQYTSVSALN